MVFFKHTNIRDTKIKQLGEFSQGFKINAHFKLQGF